MAEAVTEAKAEQTAKAGADAGDSKKAEEAKGEEKKEPELTPDQQALIEKRVQSEADKIRTKYVKELKTERDALEALKKEKMTADEKVQYEAQKSREALDIERRQVQEAKLELHALKALQASELGGELIDFVKADSEEAIDGRIKALKAYLAKHRKLVSDEILKANGRTVQQTSMSGQQLFSLEQMKAMKPADVAALMATPEGYKRLMDSQAAAAKR